MPKLTPETLDAQRDELNGKARTKNLMRVCRSTCCLAGGSDHAYKEFEARLAAAGVDIATQQTGCSGRCFAEPVLEVSADGAPRAFLGHVKSDDEIQRVVDQYYKNKAIPDEFFLDNLPTEQYAADQPEREDGQVRIVLRNSGIIDPDSIEDYIARGGYQGLKCALTELGPDGVIEEMKKSNLRGRGGAGFPTWKKWSFLKAAEADEKFMICNADEGDPGAYMDRSVLEADPHSVIEGMVIGAYATGCASGFLYVRAEYPLAIDRLEKAILLAKRNGLLGKNILGSDFEFNLEIRLGAGAFVCGEETALMNSIMGNRGTPWPRPPFPAQSGLWGKPSNINNVESLANVPIIMDKGGEWYAQYGTPESSGTKVFAVTGKIAKSGLIEAPMGMTIRQILYDICGGPGEGSETIKAIQTGGPSGGIIPADLFDTPISYESLRDLGSIMGSGGLIVMDETDSMVDIAKFYIEFSVEESCGKCAPCRIGGKQLLLLLERIIDGEGEPGDLDKMRAISKAMTRASLCGLGQTAANPVMSTMKYFESEYTEKIAALV